MVNHKRVERLMALEGLQGRSARRRVRTTVSDPGAPLSPDLVERQFGQSELDLVWLGDVTYVPTGEGWLYLANVLDACSRRAIGWSIADHLRTELCLDALLFRRMAAWARDSPQSRRGATRRAIG